MQKQNYAIILAGGTGTRLGADIPKQYIQIKGKRIIEYCLNTIIMHELIYGVQIVVADEWKKDVLNIIEKIPIKYKNKFMGFSQPGDNRQLSIYNAMCDLKVAAREDDCVMIHDSARPLLKKELITDCIYKLNEQKCGYDGVMPVLPMKDTVYFCKDGRTVSSLLNREQIFAGQAPEFFRYGKYLEANKLLLPDKILEINGSTEPAIMAGMNVAMIPGDEENFKITTENDLQRFQEIVEND